MRDELDYEFVIMIVHMMIIHIIFPLYSDILHPLFLVFSPAPFASRIRMEAPFSGFVVDLRIFVRIPRNAFLWRYSSYTTWVVPGSRGAGPCGCLIDRSSPSLDSACQQWTIWLI